MNKIFECEVIKILDHKNILINYGRANGNPIRYRGQTF